MKELLNLILVHQFASHLVLSGLRIHSINLSIKMMAALNERIESVEDKLQSVDVLYVTNIIYNTDRRGTL